MYNCQSWSKLTENDIYEFQKAQRRFLKSVMGVPEFPLWGLHNLRQVHCPIEYEISIRRLCFLWTILQKSSSDPVRMLHTEMLKLSFEENWENDVRSKALAWIMP